MRVVCAQCALKEKRRAWPESKLFDAQEACFPFLFFEKVKFERKVYENYPTCK